MNCPRCTGSSQVLDKRGNRRRRECVDCQHRWTTYELPAEDFATLQEASTQLESLQSIIQAKL